MKSLKKFVFATLSAVAIVGFISCGNSGSGGNPISTEELEGQEWLEGTWEITTIEGENGQTTVNSYKVRIDGCELDSGMTYIWDEDDEEDGYELSDLIYDIDLFLESNILDDESLEEYKLAAKENKIKFTYSGDTSLMIIGKDKLSAKAKAVETAGQNKYSYEASFVMKKLD